MAGKLACKLCILKNGVEASEMGSLFMTEADFSKHLEKDHHIPIRREGETYAQARRRFLLENPEAYDIKTCKCERCEIKRGVDQA